MAKLSERIPYKKPYCLLALLCVVLCSCKERGEHPAVSAHYSRGFDIVERSKEKTVFVDSYGNTQEIFHDGNTVSGIDAFVSPVKKAVSISAPSVTLVNAMGKIDSIAGVKLPASAWHIPEVRQRMESGRIALVGDGSHEHINAERIVALNPDIVFNNIESPEKWLSILEERKIRVLPVLTHKEDSLLGQFEWIRLLGEFYNEGEKAGKLFDEKSRFYAELKNKVKNAKRTSVLCGVVYDRSASVSGGGSVIANTVRDAGGRFLFEKEFRESDSQYIKCDLEAFFSKGLDADVFILTTTKAGGTTRISDITALNDIYARFKSFKNGNVWCYSLDFWQSIDRPDEVLADMIAILHPELMPGYKVRHFDKLY
jgi:iron complex transport system substrate-binding protein